MIQIALLAALCGAQEDLQPIESDLAQAIAEIVIPEAAKIEKPRIKVEPDSAKAVGLHVPDTYGLMAIPQKGLAEEGEGYRAETGKPLGYLFIYKMLPVVDGKEVDAGKLHAVPITGDDGDTRTVHALLLSVRRVADDDWRLYAFGPGEKPVVDAKFAQGGGSGSTPVDLTSSDKGKILLTVFDKYQASVQFAIKAE